MFMMVLLEAWHETFSESEYKSESELQDANDIQVKNVIDDKVKKGPCPRSQ